MHVDHSVYRLQAVIHIMKASLVETVRSLDEAEQILDDLVPFESHVPRSSATGARQGARPIVDTSTFSVRWNGKQCHLGGMIPFRFIERLARRLNHFVPYEQLMVDVWDGNRRSRATIRAVARDLRSALIEAGMDDLASAIKGEHQTYGLMLSSHHQ